MVKTLSKLGRDRNIFNLLTSIYKKPTANIPFNNKWLDAFPLKSETGQGCRLLPLLFNILLDVLAIAVGKKIKGIHTGKEKVKRRVFWCADDRSHVENPMESTKCYLRITNEFSQVHQAVYKIKMQKPMTFIH